MRQVLFPILFFGSALTACAAPVATPTPQSPLPLAPTAVARADTPTAPPVSRPTDGVPARSAVQPTTRPPTQPPTLAPSPLPSPTRVPAQLFQLMDGGCCVSPQWAPDSRSVLFIDKPRADAPTGIYRVNLDSPNRSELWSDRIAFYTRNFDYAQIPEQAGTRLIRISDGQELRIKNGGRQVLLSPDRTRVVWSETRETFPLENRVTNILLAPFDMDEGIVGPAQRVTQVLRGGVSGWVDDNRLLLSGRLSRDSNESTTMVYDLTTGAQTEIFTAERSRLTTLSRDGSWIAYVIVNDKDATRNGLWVERTDGTDAKKIEQFGAAQWRDGTHLIIVRFEMNAPSHAFVEYDAETGETRRLTPTDQPFKIASGDWAVSPDGKKIVFVNAADNNLWLWQFDE